MARRGFAAAALAALLVTAACTSGGAVRREPAKPVPFGVRPYWAGLSTPVADPLYPQHGNPAIDVLHYGLDLSWQPATRTLSGTATLAIRATRPLSEVSLDLAPELTVREATIDGSAVSPGHKGDKLVLPARRPIPADGQLTAVIRYEGTPRQVPMPSNRADAGGGLGLRATADGGAWTMQEPFGAYTWYPCSDHPSDEALYDMRLRTAPGWTAVASGTYEGDQDGAAVFRSTVPVATYVTTFAVGKYTHTTLTGPHGVPISLWTRPQDAPLLPTLRRTPQYLTWLESHFGPYPLATAGAVVVAGQSAMETQQLVTLGDLARGATPAVRSGVIEETMVHELAHQWFGDTVTPIDWRGVWLNEGWATYAQGLYGIDKGWFSTGEWVANMRRSDARSRARSGPPGHYDKNAFADTNVYVGPALMLHELRGKVGDAAFFAMARDWVQTQRHTHQDRESFTAFVNRHTGRDLTPILDKWLDSPTTPG